MCLLCRESLATMQHLMDDTCIQYSVPMNGIGVKNLKWEDDISKNN